MRTILRSQPTPQRARPLFCCRLFVFFRGIEFCSDFLYLTLLHGNYFMVDSVDNKDSAIKAVQKTANHVRSYFKVHSSSGTFSSKRPPMKSQKCRKLLYVVHFIRGRFDIQEEYFFRNILQPSL
jgi:hypothetical protein